MFDRILKALCPNRINGVVLASMLLFGCTDTPSLSEDEDSFLTSSSAIRLISANDGDAMQFIGNPNSDLADSLTVIDLSPDEPPRTKTVSGKLSNTYNGAPYGTTVSNGQYAFIPSNSYAVNLGGQAEPNEIAVVDLESDGLNVVQKFELPATVWQVAAHPDDQRALAISDHRFHVFGMDGEKPKLITESDPIEGYLISFAISPDGETILATVGEELDVAAPMRLELFKLEGDTVKYEREIGIKPGIGEIDQPFAPRFSPDGKRALVLNGLGIANKPPLDAILSIDFTAEPAIVSELIPNVAQGLESLAFHPSGDFAVVTCIDGPFYSHLAVVDLRSKPMRLLSYLPMAFVPQGIEFSPNGAQLFVQAASAHHIAVFDVEGTRLTRNPIVLHTGEGPGILTLVERD